MKIERRISETVKEQKIEIIRINNEQGVEISVMTLGATLLSVKQADQNGRLDEITLNFDKPSDYLANQTYFGATIGRFGNRIANGRFSLNGEEYQLAVNNGPNHLHGGIEGFNRQIWEVEIFEKADRAGVIFTRTSPDGEEGYPGTLKVQIKYSLIDDGRLKFSYKAVSDKDTIINLTNHTYWNLGGAGSGSVAEQTFFSPAERYLPVDENLIPTGELKNVEGTPFDFREEKAFGEGFKSMTGGYDHCFVMPGATDPAADSFPEVAWAGTFTDEESGRQMEVYTDQPGFQLYTCGGMTETPIGGNRTAGCLGAFCVETQKFPDTPNQPGFPSVILKAGETYIQRTIHRFSILEDEEE